MSARNTLANKAKRRAEREENAVRQVKQRIARARLQYLAMAPPKTLEELQTAVGSELDGMLWSADIKATEVVAEGDNLVPKETEEEV